ncbi:MAG: VacJ family lipoprotein [Rhodospirillales bacterium]|nr:VacJ family lipoprotein [Rhodospirillales bacterium]
MGIQKSLLAVCGLSLLLLSGCASAPPESDKAAYAEYKQTNDPGEPTNRAIFAVNKGLDDYAIKPVAKGYQYIPQPVRKSIRSFLTNMHEPWTFMNEVMQGEIKRSGQTLGRFCVNTTAGVLGFFDLMDTTLGPAHEEDFGQTLAVWGVGEGPFVTLPILGPSNPRDAVGTVVGYVADPASLALALVVPPAGMAGITVVGGIDKREKYLKELDEVERTSLDYYASLRSLYRQKRDSDIRNGAPGKMPMIDYNSMFDEPQPVSRAPSQPPAAAAFSLPALTPYSPTAPAASLGDEQRQMDELLKSMRARVSGLKS